MFANTAQQREAVHRKRRARGCDGVVPGVQEVARAERLLEQRVALLDGALVGAGQLGVALVELDTEAVERLAPQSGAALHQV